MVHKLTNTERQFLDQILIDSKSILSLTSFDLSGLLEGYKTSDYNQENKLALLSLFWHIRKLRYVASTKAAKDLNIYLDKTFDIFIKESGSKRIEITDTFCRIEGKEPISRKQIKEFLQNESDSSYIKLPKEKSEFYNSLYEFIQLIEKDKIRGIEYKKELKSLRDNLNPYSIKNIKHSLSKVLLLKEMPFFMLAMFSVITFLIGSADSIEDELVIKHKISSEFSSIEELISSASIPNAKNTPLKKIDTLEGSSFFIHTYNFEFISKENIPIDSVIAEFYYNDRLETGSYMDLVGFDDTPNDWKWTVDNSSQSVSIVTIDEMYPSDSYRVNLASNTSKEPFYELWCSNDLIKVSRASFDLLALTFILQNRAFVILICLLFVILYLFFYVKNS